MPIPPSSFAALAGATVLVNLSASNIVVGKSEYRHQLVAQQSARCLSAYMYTSAGRGESSTDLAWDGQALIYENGELLGESERFLNHSICFSRTWTLTACRASACARPRLASRSAATRTRCAGSAPCRCR